MFMTFKIYAQAKAGHLQYAGSIQLRRDALGGLEKAACAMVEGLHPCDRVLALCNHYAEQWPYRND